jgi:hypothetical protein
VGEAKARSKLGGEASRTELRKDDELAYFPALPGGELEGSALPSNETITTEFRQALPDGLLERRTG